MSERSEWKLAVISELVWEVLPRDPEDAKPWEDIAVTARYEYERNRDKWQHGDPNFDVCRDTFINKTYILGRRSEIRQHLASQGRAIVLKPGRSNGTVYKSTAPDDMDQMLRAQQKIVQGLADGHNNTVEVARQAIPELTSPYLRTVPELPSGSS